MIAQIMVSHKVRDDERFHPALRIAAKIVSVIFHPLFIPLYVTLFMIYELRVLSGISAWDRKKVFISICVNYTFLPLVTILLMKGLGFINSIFLKTQRDRILPYVVSQIFYFWGWYVAKNVPLPKPMVMFSLAVFLASCLGLICNAYLKISMHAISVGVIAALLMITAFMMPQNFGPYISIALLIAGLTCTARLIDSSHTTKEVYLGFFIGVLAQLVAWVFV
jgi:hypothetical protein